MGSPQAWPAASSTRRLRQDRPSLPILILLGLVPVSANATNRIPVLIGAITATASFHAKKALPWRLAFLVSLPAALGSLPGARLAELLPSRDLGLVITAAVLIALVLLFSKLKKVIEQTQADETRFVCGRSPSSSGSAPGTASSCSMAPPTLCSP